MPKLNPMNRIERLRKLLRPQRLPGLLVSNPVNVSYLTGFTGDSTSLVLTSNQAFLVSDSRYATQLATECPDLEVVIKGDSGTTFQALADCINSLKLAGMAVESHFLTKDAYDQLGSLVTCPLVTANSLVEELRAIKDEQELALIRQAIRINERAFEVVKAQMCARHSEREVGYALEHQMRLFGGEGCAFPPIVGVGARSALPHGGLSDKKLNESPLVLVDWGCRYQGYVSDLTRIITTGRVAAKYAKIYEVVLTAQRKAIEKIKAGVDCQVVDRAARSHIESAGFGKFFGHGLGHGIGMQVHERPYFSPSRQGTLAAGMVVTVEPGIYLPELGGVRIEDDVLVTPDGFEILSTLPKDFDATCQVLF